MRFPSGKITWSTCGLMSPTGIPAATHFDFAVEMPNVAEDGLVFHRPHVLGVITLQLPVAVTKISALSQA